MKELYETPLIEITEFDVLEIITSSVTVEDDDGDWSGWYQ